MRAIKRAICIAACLAVILSATAHAHDWSYGLTHNCHDALVLGEVVSAEDGQWVIDVYDTIVSVSSCGDFAEQIEPETVILEGDNAAYTYSGRDSNQPLVFPALGDYVLASVVHEDGDSFSVRGGIYQVDSLDTSTLSFVLPEDSRINVWWRMECAAFEYFVNSDGQVADFFFDGTTYEVGRRIGEDKEIIYRGEPQPAPAPDEREQPAPEASEPTAAAAAPPAAEAARPPSYAWAWGVGSVIIIAASVWILIRRKRKSDGENGGTT